MGPQTLLAAALLGTNPGMTAMPPIQLESGVQFMKSTPSMEGGHRVVYMEASNEARDVHSERTLASALEESKDYFLRHGRIDLDHATMTQMIRDMRLEPGNPYAREIGQPIDVKVRRDSGDIPRVIVKAVIFSSRDKGNPFTKAADWFWSSLNCTPPMKWYPSIGGTLFQDAHEHDAATGKPTRVLTKLRWHSIGLSRTPVNTTVGEVSLVPLREFAKAMAESGQTFAEILTGLGLPMNQIVSPVSNPPANLMVVPPMAGPVPGDLTAEHAATLENIILSSVPGTSTQTYLDLAAQNGISPSAALAFLVALCDSGEGLSITAGAGENDGALSYLLR